MKKSFVLFLSLFFLIANLYAKEIKAQEKENSENTKRQMTEDAEEQMMLARIKKRHDYFQYHQYAAYTSAAFMIGALATTPEGNTSNTHKTLGILSGVSYLTAAGFALAAPASEGENEKANIKVHKALAFIHGPAFALTIAAGLQAHHQRENDEELTGLAKYHSTFAGITAGAMLLSGIFSNDWSVMLIPGAKDEYTLSFAKSF